MIKTHNRWSNTSDLSLLVDGSQSPCWADELERGDLWSCLLLKLQSFCDRRTRKWNERVSSSSSTDTGGNSTTEPLKSLKTTFQPWRYATHQRWEASQHKRKAIWWRKKKNPAGVEVLRHLVVFRPRPCTRSYVTGDVTNLLRAADSTERVWLM